MFLCKNSTQNNHSCAPKEEILNFIPNLQVIANIPKTIFKLKDIDNPKMHTYDTTIFYFDIATSQSIVSYLRSENLYFDYGWASEDYLLYSTDFNLDTSTTSVSPISNETAFFTYRIRCGYSLINNYVKNQKIGDVLAKFGGLVNLIMVLAKILSFEYGQFYVNFKLMNTAFDFVRESPAKNTKKYLIFSVF